MQHFLQDFPARISRNFFPQEFPTRFSHKIFPQEFPARIFHKIFPQQFPARFSRNNFLQDFPELDPDWLTPHHPIPNDKFPPITAFLKLAFSPSSLLGKIFPQEFPATFSHKIFPQDFPTRISHKIFPQDFHTRFSHKIFTQDFPKLDPDWLAPHYPIPNAKFPPITAFLKLFFSPPPCPARISHKNFPQDFSRKNFPQDFPTTISRKIFPQDFPELDPDWLASHHPIPNAKFPPITALLNRPTDHKRSKVSPPPFPQILWEPQINE